MSLFNGHDLIKGEVVRLTHRLHFPKDVFITHVCARFIHVQGMIFWKTSGHGANNEATGYKIERTKKI